MSGYTLDDLVDAFAAMWTTEGYVAGQGLALPLDDLSDDVGPPTRVHTPAFWPSSTEFATAR